VRRRNFITLLGGAAAWPLAARAQQPERVRLIGVLMGWPKTDLEAQAQVAAFRESLQKLGWTESRNIRFEYRWAELNPEAMQRFAKELIALKPAAAPSFAVAATEVPIRDTSELESAIAALAREPGGGLIVMPESFVNVHRAEIILLAARYHVPAVYPFRYFAELGGLLSYGNDMVDNYPRAAMYVDRIFKGAKPSEFPVQAPVKFELVINLKTAKALGLDVPWFLQQRADGVIE
jgi:putative ABC transport system substrate-binding protein